MFQFNLDTEDYINLNIKKYHRSLLAQFRCGILPIQIEIGRYRNISLCHRLCPICKQAVEDEIHFLCQCPEYSEFRATLYRKANEAYPSFHNLDLFDKFVYLMSDQQREVIKYLAKAVNKRSTLINREN